MDSVPDGQKLMTEILNILEHVPVERSLSVLIHVSGGLIARHYDIEQIDEIIKMLADQVRNCVSLMLEREGKKSIPTEQANPFDSSDIIGRVKAMSVDIDTMLKDADRGEAVAALCMVIASDIDDKIRKKTIQERKYIDSSEPIALVTEIIKSYVEVLREPSAQNTEQQAKKDIH
jgi:hypothetical protein